MGQYRAAAYWHQAVVVVIPKQLQRLVKIRKQHNVIIKINLLFSRPRIRENTDCNPMRFNTYHETAETHLTSRSFVATPDCNMLLNRTVRGNGKRMSTNPLKSVLIQLIMSVWGTKFMAWPFTILNIPSIILESVSDGALPAASGFFKYRPFLNCSL